MAGTKCPECNGSGRVSTDEGNAGPKYMDCPACSGTGYKDFVPSRPTEKTPEGE